MRDSWNDLGMLSNLKLCCSDDKSKISFPDYGNAVEKHLTLLAKVSEGRVMV